MYLEGWAAASMMGVLSRSSAELLFFLGLICYTMKATSIGFDLVQYLAFI